MQDKRIYTINENKLNNCYLTGLKVLGDSLVADGGDSSLRVVIFNRFRSYERETRWGRFACGIDMDTNNTFRILALASDGDEEKAVRLNDFFHSSTVPWQEKRAYFEESGQIFTNHKDVLLYDVVGEYLWIAIEVFVKEDIKLHDMKLDSQGDNFMQTFPEIYREEGGFFHRYMSIYSSIFQDMLEKVYDMDKYLEVDSVPLLGLGEIASWLGFEIRENFLEEGMLRRFVKQLYSLNRIKGTKHVLEEIIRLLLGDDAVILERSKMENHIPKSDSGVYGKLYGNTIYDVAILVKHGEDEKLQAQMMVILEEFKPVRSNIKLIFAQKNFYMDSYCYLDFNASLDKKSEAYIGGNNKMNGMVKLG
jgi:phage tail-like protein